MSAVAAEAEGLQGLGGEIDEVGGAIDFDVVQETVRSVGARKIERELCLRHQLERRGSRVVQVDLPQRIVLDAVEDQELGEEQEAGVGVDGEVERIGEIKPVAGARLDVGLVLVDQIAAVGGDRGERAGRYVVGEVADALEARRVAEGVADADVEVVRIRIDLDRIDEVGAGAVVAGERED